MSLELLLNRVKALKLHGLIEHWGEVKELDWVNLLVEWEENTRGQRSLEARLKGAKLGRFKPLSEFDWNWPKYCPRDVIERWLQLNFLDKATNLILSGSNGVGKTTIACNIARQSILKGHTALFTTAAKMLNELAAIDSSSALTRRLKYYIKPNLLVIDEIGYLSYSNRHADLLFEIISQRYEESSTIITTNKVFNEWRDIFPNATCVVTIVDRLLHHSEIINIDAESFRLKEAKENSEALKKVANNT